MRTLQLTLPAQNAYVGPQGAHVGLQGKAAPERISVPAERSLRSSFQNEFAALSSVNAEPNAESDSGASTSELQSDSKDSGLVQSQQALNLSAVLGKPISLQITQALQQSKTTSSQMVLANEPNLKLDGQSTGASRVLVAAAKASSLKAAAGTTTLSEVKPSKTASTRNEAVRMQHGSGQASFTNLPASMKVEPGDTSKLSEKANPVQHSNIEPAESKSIGPSDKVNVANPVAGDLAVAMQVKYGPQEEASLRTSADEETSEDEKVEPSAGTHGQLLALEPQRSQQRSADATQIISAVSDSHTQQASSQTENRAAESNTKPVDPADFHTELDTAQNEPVRGAHVQIAGENNEKVDIRLFERGGALSVTVRSGDTNLNRALQEHIPELTARLSLDHFRTETWTPNASRSAEQRNPDGGNSAKHGNSAQDEQNPNERRGKQNQQQPDWIDELEARPVPFFRKG